MNRHGETFEDLPSAGEYWLCPIRDCRYKLLVALPIDVTKPNSRLSPLWMLGSLGYWMGAGVPPETFEELVTGAVDRQIRNREERMMLHLSSHDMRDFYLTCDAIMAGARKRSEQMMRLADHVFRATATRSEELREAKGGGRLWG